MARLRITFDALVAALVSALSHLDDRAQQAIWHDNALAFYRLPGVLVTSRHDSAPVDLRAARQQFLDSGD